MPGIPTVPILSAVCSYASWPPCPCAYWSSCLGARLAPINCGPWRATTAGIWEICLWQASCCQPHAHHGSCHHGELDLLPRTVLWPARVPPPLPPCHHQPMPLPPSAAATREQCTQCNTRFAPGTLLLFEEKLTFPHLQQGQHYLLQHKGKPPLQPAGGPHLHPCDRADSLARGGLFQSVRSSATLRAIESQPGVNALLEQGQRTHEPDVRDILPTATGLLPSSSTRRTANKPSRRTSMRGRERMMPTKLHPGA